MCGRYTVSKARDVLSRFLDREISGEIHLPIYNASPGQFLPVVLDAEPGRIVPALWGIKPDWERPASRLLINARAESVNSRPTFRDSFRKRRCLVLADGFYEWQAAGEGKLPYLVRLKSREPFAFAGIWETVAGKPAYVILTTDANAVTRPVHERMPVILERHEEKPWLDRDLPAGEVLKLLDPYPEDAMTAYRVSKAVNSSSNDGPELIEPLHPNPDRVPYSHDCSSRVFRIVTSQHLTRSRTRSIHPNTD